MNDNTLNVIDKLLQNHVLLYLIIGIVAFIVIVILLGFKTSKTKGEYGEQYVTKLLNSLDKKNYIILNDIILRTSDNNTTQIDHIVVSTFGIFVIETKNYSGWIFGKEKSENWTQTTRFSKNQFRNPIKQNWAHIFALKSLLSNYGNIPFYPIIAFVGSAQLRNVQSDTPVVYGYDILDVIKRSSTNTYLTETEIQSINDLILTNNITNKETKKEHIHNIQRNIIERETLMENCICPKCGGDLKIREGVNGKFFGCSNYPKCKFTMPY
ncbi:MAG: NERD domain-containing protein [Bacteroidales bacterium]|nr:NERD domain-containing protein [Bacteroidales bacterium]